MEIILPSDMFLLLQAQADGGAFHRAGVRYEVTRNERGPWHPERGPAVEGTSPMGQVLIRQGLPLERLQQEQAARLEAEMRKRPGWRRRFFPDDAPEWAFYQGHPVALYWDEEGRRWASLLFVMQGGGVAELLLDRSLAMDPARPATPEAPPVRAREQLQLELFV